LASEAVALEIARHIPPLAAKRGLDPALLFAALGVMPVEWKASSEYEDHREQPEERIAARDPEDWPSVALALKLDLPVWSRTRTSPWPASRCSRRGSCSTRWPTREMTDSRRRMCASTLRSMRIFANLALMAG